MDGASIVGDFKDQVAQGEPLPDEAPRLAIRGLALSGDVIVGHPD